jgi:peptide-methionine (R)-S-oxide reductase
MRRRIFVQGLCGAAFSAISLRTLAQPGLAHDVDAAFAPLQNPSTPWHQLIDADRFDILFREETEFAGSSPLNEEKRSGTYVCAACYLPLFRSEHKYDSGTGWPSFTQPIETHVLTRADRRWTGVRRTGVQVPREQELRSGRGREPIIEYHCARCSGHQGHVFDDGPPPRGERWCNNGLAVVFVAKGEPLPKLRG